MGSRDMFGISISLGSGERYLPELEKAGMVGYTDIWAPRNLSHVMNWGKYLTRWNIDDENECQVFCVLMILNLQMDAFLPFRCILLIIR